MSGLMDLVAGAVRRASSGAGKVFAERAGAKAAPTMLGMGVGARAKNAFSGLSGLHWGEGAKTALTSMFWTGSVGSTSLARSVAFRALPSYGAGATLDYIVNETKFGDEHPLLGTAASLTSKYLKFSAFRMGAQGAIASGMRTAGALRGSQSIVGTTGGGPGFSAAVGVKPRYANVADPGKYFRSRGGMPSAYEQMMKVTGGLTAQGSLMNYAGRKTLGLAKSGLKAAALFAPRQAARTVIGIPYAAGALGGLAFDTMRAPFRAVHNARTFFRGGHGAASGGMLPLFGNGRSLMSRLEPQMPGKLAGFTDKLGITSTRAHGGAPVSSGLIGLGIGSGLMMKRDPRRRSSPYSGPQAMMGRNQLSSGQNFGPALTLAIHNNRSRVF